MRKTNTYEMDMCSGSLVRKIITFSIPLMLTGILQLMYNAADIIVVGQFTGKEALAAVGSTGSLINLLINIFMGLSVGTSVVIAQRSGANDHKGVHDAVHTSMALALYSGVGVALLGILAAKPLLELMGSPEDVIDASVLYMRIYFLGMPVNMLYTFGSAILRAVGDTRRPLLFLSVSGLVNVALNLVFVISFHMGVAGVAWATILSQAISAALVLHCLIRSDTAIRFEPRHTRIYREPMRAIARIGLPAGLQGSVFSISNVLIQSSVNSFGSITMAGSAASSNVEGFIYVAMNSFYQACLSFVGQNWGARRYGRVRRILWVCLGLVTAVGLAMGILCALLAPQLLSVYNTDPRVIQQGVVRLSLIAATYCLCGIMEVCVGQLRGIGYSMVPMLVSIVGVCGVRIGWIYTVFAQDPRLEILFLSYPVSWAFTALVQFISYQRLQRRFPREDAPDTPCCAQG